MTYRFEHDKQTQVVSAYRPDGSNYRNFSSLKAARIHFVSRARLNVLSAVGTTIATTLLVPYSVELLQHTSNLYESARQGNYVPFFAAATILGFNTLFTLLTPLSIYFAYNDAKNVGAIESKAPM